MQRNNLSKHCSHNQLEEKVSRIPEKLKGVEKKLVDQEHLHDQMIQLQPQVEHANATRTELEKIRCVLS